MVTSRSGDEIASGTKMQLSPYTDRFTSPRAVSMRDAALPSASRLLGQRGTHPEAQLSPTAQVEAMKAMYLAYVTDRRRRGVPPSGLAVPRG